MSEQLINNWQATFSEANRRLEAFRPSMGRAYASRRNFDFGPERRDNISLLSPYLRRRLLLERDVVSAALSDHTLEGADKFIQEVFWRGYWKGWLEHRPTVWQAYKEGLESDLAGLQLDTKLRQRIEKAEHGRSGIDCFDSWALELRESGYLHNHARMWFASIWIFTLELPWRLGADFFMRHLLDGDPASNTLGWRWVAGLHTKGKAYAAQAWNIAKFTDGRFAPSPGTLNDNIQLLEEAFDFGPAQPVRTHQPFEPERPSVLLITEEDCQPETLGVPLDRMRGVATLLLSNARSPNSVSAAVTQFDRDALADAVNRAMARGAPAATPLDHPSAKELSEWALGCGATQIVTAFIPRGPVQDWLSAASPSLETAGITVTETQRDWDRAIWPHATAGFFKVKKQIPRLIEQIY